MASAGGVRTPKKTGGGTLGAVIAGTVAGTVAASAGADLQTTLESVEAVVTGTAPDLPPADASSDDQAVEVEMSPDELAGRLEEQERLRQVEGERQRREEELGKRVEIQQRNARILSSDCSCIRINDDGEYACLDGLVQSRNSSRRLCDNPRLMYVND